MTTPDFNHLVDVVQEAEFTHRVQHATVTVLGDEMAMEAIPTADGTIGIEFVDGSDVIASTEANVPTKVETLRPNIVQTYARAELVIGRQKARESAGNVRDAVTAARKRFADRLSSAGGVIVERDEMQRRQREQE